MTAARSIPPGGLLVVLAPFDPMPLYGVLAKMGFSNETEALGSEGFRISFRRRVHSRERMTEVLDLRGLPPPEPLVKTLEARGGSPRGRGARRPDRALPRAPPAAPS